mmetsp:Transcript_9343/g.20231  ORF Transcript_9343/g.20231 Transcript_9343/m.20231 type:complete len:80 (-) Transcript_9343:131-370(-)
MQTRRMISLGDSPVRQQVKLWFGRWAAMLWTGSRQYIDRHQMIKNRAQQYGMSPTYIYGLNGLTKVYFDTGKELHFESL